ncbi:MAG: ABC transporter permease [Elusimicrobia bacterium]|nr:ABC transporter permease [Elusimicrobiota bacterium]
MRSSYLRLLWQLTWAEFKLLDQSTVTGFFWTLLQPALMFVVLYALFTRLLGHGVDNYPAYLVTGLVGWRFFEKSTSYALNSLKRKASLLRNFRFPRELIVLSAFGSVLIAHAAELVVLLGFLAAIGIRPGAGWLLLPLPVLLNILLALGVSMVLAMLVLVYEDMERIWSILMTAAFFLTPVFYPASMLTESQRGLLALNPMVHVLDAFRWSLLATPVSSIGAVVVLAGAAVLSAASFFLFRRNALRWMDRIISP